jgi:hypothetical protein
MRWGGAFGTQLHGGGPPDLMHFDTGIAADGRTLNQGHITDNQFNNLQTLDGTKTNAKASLTQMTPEELAAKGVDAKGNPVNKQGGNTMTGTPMGAMGFGGVASSDSTTCAPLYLTDPNAVASKAGESAKTGLTDLGKKVESTGTALDTSITQITQSAEQTGTSWFDFLGRLFLDPNGILPRAGVIMAGAIMIGIALWVAGSGAIKRGV